MRELPCIECSVWCAMQGAKRTLGTRQQRSTTRELETPKCAIQIPRLCLGVGSLIQPFDYGSLLRLLGAASSAMRNCWQTTSDCSTRSNNGTPPLRNLQYCMNHVSSDVTLTSHVCAAGCQVPPQWQILIALPSLMVVPIRPLTPTRILPHALPSVVDPTSAPTVPLLQGLLRRPARPRDLLVRLIPQPASREKKRRSSPCCMTLWGLCVWLQMGLLLLESQVGACFSNTPAVWARLPCMGLGVGRPPLSQLAILQQPV